METTSPRRSGTVSVNGEALTDALGRRGISGQQLAEVAGVTPETVWRILRGFHCRPVTAMKLAQALKAIPVFQDTEQLLTVPNGKTLDGEVDVMKLMRVSRRLAPPDPNEGIPPPSVDGLKVVDVTGGYKQSR